MAMDEKIMTAAVLKAIAGVKDPTDRTAVFEAMFGAVIGHLRQYMEINTIPLAPVGQIAPPGGGPVTGPLVVLPGAIK